MFQQINGEFGVRKVIIVDDDAEIRGLVQEFMEGHELETVTLAEGGNVVATAIKEQPDIIILDINLPDVDGLEVLRQLKERPITSFIPVVMLTGKTSSDSQIKGLMTGADDYVTKPFDLNVLYARVVNALRRSMMQTRSKYDQYNLLRYLIHHYKKRDYIPFTKLLSEYADHPEYWKGFVPDLIIERGGKYRCFNFETSQSLLEPQFLDRLKAMADLIDSWSRPLEVNVIVRSKDNRKLAERIIEENQLPVTVKYIKHHTHK